MTDAGLNHDCCCKMQKAWMAWMGSSGCSLLWHALATRLEGRRKCFCVIMKKPNVADGTMDQYSIIFTVFSISDNPPKRFYFQEHHWKFMEIRIHPLTHNLAVLRCFKSKSCAVYLEGVGTTQRAKSITLLRDVDVGPWGVPY